MTPLVLSTRKPPLQVRDSIAQATVEAFWSQSVYRDHDATRRVGIFLLSQECEWTQ